MVMNNESILGGRRRYNILAFHRFAFHGCVFKPKFRVSRITTKNFIIINSMNIDLSNTIAWVGGLAVVSRWPILNVDRQCSVTGDESEDEISSTT
jgi:hypothetical protein